MASDDATSPLDGVVLRRAGVGQAHRLVTPEYLREGIGDDAAAEARRRLAEREARYLRTR